MHHLEDLVTSFLMTRSWNRRGIVSEVSWVWLSHDKQVTSDFGCVVTNVMRSPLFDQEEYPKEQVFWLPELFMLIPLIPLLLYQKFQVKQTPQGQVKKCFNDSLCMHHTDNTDPTVYWGLRNKQQDREQLKRTGQTCLSYCLFSDLKKLATSRRSSLSIHAILVDAADHQVVQTFFGHRWTQRCKMLSAHL